MNRSILWIDNDPAQIRPFVQALTDEGYVVDVVTTFGGGLQAVESERRDLVILDVMLPTTEAEEELGASPAATDQGYRTGLMLFKRIREKLAFDETPVLVLTVRLDQAIREEFIDAGLAPERFATKFALRESRRFVTKVRQLIQGGPE